MESGGCVHVNTLGDITKEDILRKHETSQCSSCSIISPNLWLCLHYGCQYIGCDEQGNDHSTRHFKDIKDHCLTFNLTSLRLWCYVCECEVFLPSSSSQPAPPSHRMRSSSNSAGDYDSDDENQDDDHSMKPRGLTGLQNIGNTCYMNSAIQALSNCPPLTQFFLDCGSFVRSDLKPGLAKSYLKLMSEMWNKKRPSYVVPSSIAYGIKIVFPMFRGYTQQDSQEFLRCFMDQLHEELKEPVVLEAQEKSRCSETALGTPPEKEIAMDTADDSSQSEAEYETCDSGLSSEKSSCSSEDVSSSAELPTNPSTVAGGGATERKRGHHHHRGGAGGSRRELTSTATKWLTGASSHRHGEIRENGGYVPLLSGHGDAADGVDNREYNDVASTEDHSPLNDSAAVLSSFPPSPSSTPAPNFQQQQRHQYHNLSASAPQIGGSGGGLGRGLSSSAGVTSGDLLPGAARFQSQMAIAQGQSAAGTAATAASSHQRSSGGRRKRQVKFRSVISDVFDGKLLSSVQCLTCDRVSATKETFQDLSLPIPSREYLNVLHASQSNVVQKGSLSTCTDVYSNQGWITWMFSWMKSWFMGPTVSLQDCLAAFFSADELKGDNMYSCEKCKKLRNGIKYSKVLELPEILCVHLKRFRHEVMFSSKISSYVSFPLEGLDLQPFLHKDCPSAVTTYDLVAVICHHGTAGGGHYTAYGLNCINDQWYEFDDQYVTEVDPRIVASCEAYVLFYRKASEDIMKKRQRAMELMEISVKEPSLMHFYISKQWVNKFNTFSEPGPIDNSDFLCPHAGVHPSKINHVDSLYTVFSQGVWEYLHDSFGGGPPCTHLYLCTVCQQEIDNLDARRKQELDEFIKLHREFMAQDSSSFIFAISMSWFRMWENFVRGKENDPPGPIDNSAIAITKNGLIVVKVGSDYAQVSEEMWHFLWGIYGGGPQLTLRLGIGVPGSTASNATGDSGHGGGGVIIGSDALFGATTVAAMRETASMPSLQPAGDISGNSAPSAATASPESICSVHSNPSVAFAGVQSPAGTLEARRRTSRESASSPISASADKGGAAVHAPDSMEAPGAGEQQGDIWRRRDRRDGEASYADADDVAMDVET